MSLPDNSLELAKLYELVNTLRAERDELEKRVEELEKIRTESRRSLDQAHAIRADLEQRLERLHSERELLDKANRNWALADKKHRNRIECLEKQLEARDVVTINLDTNPIDLLRYVLTDPGEKGAPLCKLEHLNLGSFERAKAELPWRRESIPSIVIDKDEPAWDAIGRILDACRLRLVLSGGLVSLENAAPGGAS